MPPSAATVNEPIYWRQRSRYTCWITSLGMLLGADPRDLGERWWAEQEAQGNHTGPGVKSIGKGNQYLVNLNDWPSVFEVSGMKMEIHHDRPAQDCIAIVCSAISDWAHAVMVTAEGIVLDPAGTYPQVFRDIRTKYPWSEFYDVACYITVEGM